jgi:hypothetical protein
MSEASANSQDTPSPGTGLDPGEWDQRRKCYVRYITEQRTVTRLSPEVYRSFVKNIPKPVIDRTAPDSGCDASFKLGIQYVLERLRDELVVE